MLHAKADWQKNIVRNEGIEKRAPRKKFFPTGDHPPPLKSQMVGPLVEQCASIAKRRFDSHRMISSVYEYLNHSWLEF